MSEFLAMGGYAWYVWMSYGAVAVAVIVEVATLRTRRRRAYAALRMTNSSATERATSMRGAG